jgi:beta-lactamase class D
MLMLLQLDLFLHIPTGDLDIKAQFTIAAATDAQKKLIKYDADLLADTDLEILVFDTDHDDFDTANADFDNLSAFDIENVATHGLQAHTGLGATAKIVRRLTSSCTIY